MYIVHLSFEILSRSTTVHRYVKIEFFFESPMCYLEKYYYKTARI